jgi:hypothetical protein
MMRSILFPASLLTALSVCSLAHADDASRSIQVDARGPIHEAYAQPWQPNPSASSAVDKKPPEPIPEQPAAQRPAGTDVRWIPGYWQWDPDRKDFVWVSGTWREAPEARRWIMGYWANTPEGWRWVSGHWAATPERDNQYVPNPPNNPDTGAPTTPQTDPDTFYIPGSWFYGEQGYYYRDGYWAAIQANRLWVPARYIWSPYGYIFASGYWDYPLADRGLLFAPVFFTDPLWNRPGWFYRPWFALRFSGFFGAFFVNTWWNHYCFGDYYPYSYVGWGITPWFWYSHHCYDPIWHHQFWVNRNNPQWAAGLRSTYVNRLNGVQSSPARTFAAQTSLAVAGLGNTASPTMVQPLNQLHGQQLQAVSPQVHTAQLQAAQQMIGNAQTLSRGSGSRTAFSTSGGSRNFAPSSSFSGSSGSRPLFSSGGRPSFSSGSGMGRPSTGGSLGGSSGGSHGSSSGGSHGSSGGSHSGGHR